jgi:hypothetical protein
MMMFRMDRKDDGATFQITVDGAEQCSDRHRFEKRLGLQPRSSLR